MVETTHEPTSPRKRLVKFEDLMTEKIQESNGTRAQPSLIDDGAKNGVVSAEKEVVASPRSSTSEVERVKHIVLVEVDDDSGISDSAAIEETALIDTETHVEPVTEREGVVALILQVFIPFLIAGFGMMMAGMLLDHVQVVRSTRTMRAYSTYV